MIEQVGVGHFDAYFPKVRRLPVPNGFAFVRGKCQNRDSHDQVARWHEPSNMRKSEKRSPQILHGAQGLYLRSRYGFPGNRSTMMLSCLGRAAYRTADTC
jgi:hypothetical protein